MFADHTVRQGKGPNAVRPLQPGLSQAAPSRRPSGAAEGWDFSATPCSARPAPLPAGVQARLAVGALNDPLEREADQVADHVLGCSVPATPAPAISRAGALAAHDGNRAPAAVQSALGSGGHPLDAGARAYFEPRFGRDFSQVRVHTGSAAAASADALGAAAYTVGHNLVFASSHYAPHSSSGRRLLAHELTHVVQQGQAGAGQRLARDPRHDRGFGGEQNMGFIHYRQEDGWIVFEGPSGAAGHGITEPGFDAVAYNTRTGEIHIADNKSLARQGNVGSATAIDPSRNLGKNLDGLIARVEAAKDVPGRIRLLGRLRALRTALLSGQPLPADVKLVVPTVGGRSTGVTGRLASQGVQHLPEPAPPPVAPAPTAPVPAPPGAPQVPKTAAPAPVAEAPVPKPAEPVLEPVAPPVLKPGPVMAPPPRPSFAWRAGLKAGGKALVYVLIFAGLEYLVHRELAKELEAAIERAMRGAMPWAQRLKREDPSRPVYMSVKVESKEYSRYLPFLGWLPDPPVLHMIAIEMVRAPIDPPQVMVHDQSLDLFHPGVTKVVTYTELMVE